MRLSVLFLFLAFALSDIVAQNISWKPLKLLPDSSGKTPFILAKTDTLPICIAYADFEDYENYSRPKSAFVKGKTLLSAKTAKATLFPGKDSVGIYNILNGSSASDEKVAIEAHLARVHYYFVDTLLKAPLFFALIYEVIAGEKFLCTFNNSGHLISMVPVAAYFYAGTATGYDGRMEWWATNTGCIDEQLILTVNGSSPSRKYKIQLSGRIEELKN